MSPHDANEREKLLRVIREVRARWRRRVALRSVTVLVGAAVITVLAAAWGLERYRFRPEAIVAFRVITYAVLAGTGWWFLVRPLLRRVTDMQVALYLEEHEPSLESLLISAVDGSQPGRRGPAESAALLERLVHEAVERCERIRHGREVERRRVRQSWQVLAGIGATAVVVFLGGPAYFRHGAMTLLVPSRGVEASSPYRIEVTPGDTTIPQGGDLAVAARLVGFASGEGSLFTRSSPGGAFERAAMIPSGDGRLEATLFRLRESIEYFVEAAGVRSAVHKAAVAALPQVERLELEYVFPQYTGLAPQRVENGGDIAVLAGTKVRVRVHATLPSPGGRIALEGDRPAPLTAAAGEAAALDGEFEVRREGSYRIELQALAGQVVQASPQYAIDVLADMPPSVTFSRPQRDLRPTSIEEVFAEARAEDDFGLQRLDLVFSVNGGGEKSVRLGGGARAPKQLSAGHTFFLEEMNLQPGDVVAYYARATDNDAVSGGKTATSDIYFLRIRPLRKDYRAAESQAGGQAGGQGAEDPSALSDEQRRIVTGTFNVARDRDKAGAEKFREDVVFLALAQGQLRQRVEALAGQINTRLGAGASDGGMKDVAGHLVEAARQMQAAEPRLQARDPKGALPPEQRALRSLQAAEEAYRDVRVTMSQERGGQGGGGSPERQEELAQLFELELDRLKNQYETFRRGQQQSGSDRVDEMLERLRELARRQEQEAERQRRMAGSPGGGDPSAGAARQRQLAQETEEAARRLERLAREQRRQDLADAARQMQQAADAMRRAAAAGDQGAFGEARAAAERLGQARRGLEQERSDRLGRAIEEARSRVRRLAEEQERIEGEVQGLPGAGAERAAQARELNTRKEAQAGEVADIERQLDRTASDFQRERRDAARKLQEAADGIRDSRLKEKIRYSRGLVQNGPPDAASAFEEQIGADLTKLDERLAEAAKVASSAGGGDSRAEALERARDLLRGVESMSERTRQAAGAGRQAGQEPQGRAGEQARAGEQGQAGEQGRAGEPGRPGESGGQGTSGQQSQAGRGGEARGSQQSAGGRERAEGSSSGAPPQAGGGGNGRPGAIDPEQARQLRREARERGADAERLQRDLRGLGVEPGDLDRLIRDLRSLDRAGLYEDPVALSRLQAQLLEGFRRFEFDLRRKLDEGGDVLLSGADQVPDRYRSIVEEYYRSLARERKK